MLIIKVYKSQKNAIKGDYMKINDFLNDNFIILKIMYDNQVTVLNETQIPLSQIQIADALGYSKNKVYSVFKKLQQEGYIETIGKGKYRLSDTSIVIIETMEKLDKELKGDQ